MWKKYPSNLSYFSLIFSVIVSKNWHCMYIFHQHTFCTSIVNVNFSSTVNKYQNTNLIFRVMFAQPKNKYSMGNKFWLFFCYTVLFASLHHTRMYFLFCFVLFYFRTIFVYKQDCFYFHKWRMENIRLRKDRRFHLVFTIVAAAFVRRTITAETCEMHIHFISQPHLQLLSSSFTLNPPFFSFPQTPFTSQSPKTNTPELSRVATFALVPLL